MRQNENLVLVADKILLVPYLRIHVEKYNLWMKSPELLELTDSEPLTLAEEYEMQVSWREDPKKCTFIIFQNTPDLYNKLKGSSTDKVIGIVGNTDLMIGDVNLYLNDYYDESRAEIEVMIAEQSGRGKGAARQALQLMMHYAINNLNISCFYCRILAKNSASMSLFKSLNFTQTEYSEYFDQYTFELAVGDELKSSLNTQFLDTLISLKI